MSIFDTLFNRGQQPAPAPQPAQQPTTPGNIPPAPNTAPVANAATAPNGAVPNNVPASENKTGLDTFADLWNVNNDGNTQGQPLFNVSQDKLMEAARKQNFTANIPPDLMEKINAGGAEAMAAMLEAMNHVSQAAYAQSAFASTRLIETALDKSQFAKSSELDSRFKSMSVANTLQAENPIFTNPAAKPLLDTVQQQMLQKYPNATPAELSRMAQEYLTNFAAAVNGPQQAQQQQAKAKANAGEDWSNFFDQR